VVGGEWGGGGLLDVVRQVDFELTIAVLTARRWEPCKETGSLAQSNSIRDSPTSNGPVVDLEEESQAVLAVESRGPRDDVRKVL
jgi:hypothetical protein